jgi:hypothetical protein
MLRSAETPEQEHQAALARRQVYEDVEQLVSPGFLAHDLMVGGVPLSMRSLLPGDRMLLRHRVGVQEKDLVWKRWAVAMSIWMVDGQPLLESPYAASRIYRAVQRLPQRALDILFSICTGLTARVNEALGRIEAFCYEPFGRNTWRSLRGLLPSDDRATGIPGTGRLGLNAVQKVWIMFNEAEDDQEEWLQQWQAAKFIASAHNPKGVRKVSRKDESTTKAEKARRERVIDEVFIKATGGLPDGSGKPRLYRAITADDLVDEMKRWVGGEQDFHDMVVEDYKTRIRVRMEEERQLRVEEEEARLAAAMAAGQAGEDAVEIRPLVGYTLEQLAEITDGRPGGSRKGSVVYDSSNLRYVFDKYVEQEIRAGAVRTDGTAVGVPKGPPNQESDLQAKLRGRRVTVQPEGGE